MCVNELIRTEERPQTVSPGVLLNVSILPEWSMLNASQKGSGYPRMSSKERAASKTRFFLAALH